ncbi:MAG: glycosyltransferase family 2 protein [Oscillospiraceae bacterium]|nr:glycosyltransferase family 2 protein [Oscillospiraceae bacterium]MDO4508885.1 glycosyltransferase family 2 protein [Lachnospiraceae bacterium]
MDKISVIVPCYNAAAYLSRCLDSIVNQTYGIDNLEVICINDASTDSTFDILCQYERKYPESFLIINNEINTKQGYARNLAIKYSSGDYITFVDSDDYVDEAIIEKLYNQMQKSDYDYVSCRFYRIDNNTAYIVDGNKDECDSIIDSIIDSDDKRKSFILDESSSLGCWATLYQKSFVIDNNIHFAEGIVYEDLLWLGTLRLYANHICIIPDRLYYYVNYNNTSIVTSVNSTHHFDRLKAMKQYLNECKSRGFYTSFKSEIDTHFIWIYFVNSIILFARRMSYVPSDILNEMVSTIRSEIPDYKTNSYIKQFEGISVTILSLIDANITSQEAWNEVINVLSDI